MMEWQPIESAPRDGTIILVADSLRVYAAGWAPAIHGEKHPWVLLENLNLHQPVGCCDREDDARVEVNAWAESAPTHWMPLPAAPTPVDAA